MCTDCAESAGSKGVCLARGEKDNIPFIHNLKLLDCQRWHRHGIFGLVYPVGHQKSLSSSHLNRVRKFDFDLAWDGSSKLHVQL
jgi:hypothetical protein